MSSHEHLGNGPASLKMTRSTVTGSAVPATGSTCEAFFLNWLDSVKRNKRRQTYQGYKSCVNNHLIPVFGGLPLADLTEERIQAQFDGNGDTLSNKSLHNLLDALRHCLDEAVRRGLIPCNPARRIVLAPLRPAGIQILSEAQQQTLCRHLMLEDSNEAAAVLLLLYAGPTMGELLALVNQDIDLDKKVLHITKVQKLGTDGWRSEPLEGAACREAPMLDPLVEYLKRHPPGQPDQTVICRRGRKQYDTSAFGRLLHRRLAELEIPATAINLRDTYAISLLYEGFGYDSVMRAMGFAQGSASISKYIRYMEEQEKTYPMIPDALWSD